MNHTLPENVTDPEWWAARVRACGGDLQRAQFDGNAEAFAAHHNRQMNELRRAGIKPTDSVLDAGCGYGRLLTMMPPEWDGYYCGVDSCREFIQIAQVLWSGRLFFRSDLTIVYDELGFNGYFYHGQGLKYLDKFDVAVCVWVRSMLVSRELGETWGKIETELHRVARRVVVID